MLVSALNTFISCARYLEKTACTSTACSSDFRKMVKYNYGPKFDFSLNNAQVNALVTKFVEQAEGKAKAAK